LHIGLFTDTFLPVVDGVGRVAVAYAQNLPLLGHQVTVSAPLTDIGYRGGLPFDLIDFYMTVKVPTAPQYRTGIPLMDAHYRRRMAKTKLDIVHVHSPFVAGKEGQRVAKAKKVPLIATFHSKYYDDFYKATKSKTVAEVAVNRIVHFYHQCDQVWAVNESTAGVLKTYGFQKEIIVMPNGATIREVNPEKTDEVEQLYSLQNLPLLLFVGQLNWKKNIKRVLEATHLLKEKEIPFCLLLVGQGPDQAAIESKIKELGLERHARCIGHISDAQLLDALYARAELLCFPSLYDNAPMVVNEAAVMGTPPVLIRGSSAADAVTDGVNGYLCEDNKEDLAAILEKVLQSPDENKAIGQKAKETIPLPWIEVMKRSEIYYQLAIDKKLND
jgi:glycosyltransferase involved in cell wall biosynthesis